jgi:putative redox protein
MPSIKVSFPNDDGQTLAAALELPDTVPEFYALFAHCFTCSKDVNAANRISRRLCDNGVAVLRFDFTGLGNSEGDFANTNFSSNVQDIISAAAFLEESYDPVKLLIGHSLGGAAVLTAAQQLSSVRALVTIAAPATGAHVEHLFTNTKQLIQNENEAEVLLGGRKFTIKKQFLNDIEKHNSIEHIASLDKALLIFHSPIDTIVSIDEAAKIYLAARHPKSFISLDKADHLLSNPNDSQYVADIIVDWISRYIKNQKNDPLTESNSNYAEHNEVIVQEEDHLFTQNIFTDSHSLKADEPATVGGRNLGPNPYEYLMAALGACTSMTIRMYANRKQIPLKNIEVTLRHSRIHAKDCEDCETDKGMIDVLDKNVTLDGNLSQEQKEKLMEIAEKCPVHKTLLNDILINTKLCN